MATIGNLVNAGQRGDTQDPSAFSVLADIIYKRGEEQRQELVKQQRLKNSMQMLQSIAAENLNPNDSRGIVKGGHIAENGDVYGTKTIPANATMSTPDGGYADVTGKPIPMSKPQTRTPIPQSRNPLNIKGTVNGEGEVSLGFDFVDPNADLPELQKTTAAKGGRIFQNREEQLAELARVSNEKAAEETPTEKRARIKDLNQVTQTLTTNKSSRTKISDVLTRIDSVPAGRFGAMNIDWMKNFDPNNVKLSDWQAVKSVLTDTTLLKSMQTKGSISDSEMNEFRKAAANDDLISPARIKEALADYVRKLDAEDEGLVNSYKLSWKDDPREMLEGISNQSGGIQTFKINGKTYQIPADQVEEFKKDMGL